MPLNNVPLVWSREHTAARKETPYEVLDKAWEVVGTDIFMINNENLLCIIDYYSKFPVVIKVESARFVFAGFGLPKILLSDAGTNFVSEQFKDFCRHLNIDQVMTCIKLVECSIKMQTD